MSTPITYTTWTRTTKTAGVEETADWSALTAMLRDPPERSGKSECPMIKLATFKNASRAAGAQVMEINGIEGDYDAGAVTLDEAAARLAAAGVRAFLHTSASHSTQEPRWRVIVPLSRAYSPTEHARLLALLNGALGGILAPESFDPSRCYFYGQVRGAIYESRTIEGEFLDKLDSLITPIGKPGSSAPAGMARTPVSTADNDLARQIALDEVDAQTIADLRSALAAIPIPVKDKYNDWLRKVLALASLKETAFAAEAYELADEWSQRFSAEYDSDELARKWTGTNPDRITYKSIFKLAAEAGWANPRKGKHIDTHAPIPFDAETPPTAWPQDAMPAAMEQAAQAIAYHVQAPLAIAAFAVLGAVAHLAQGTANAEGAKGGALPCSLFTLALLGSGDRKSACFNLATEPVTKAEAKARIEHRTIVAELDRDEKAKRKTKSGEQSQAIKPPDPRTIYGADSTVEAIARDFVQGSKPALTWATDEGGIVFGGHSLKSDTRLAAMGMFTRLFDGAGVDRSRVTEGIGSGFRFGIRFGMFLSCQPIAAREALADPMMQGQGLLPRFLLCAPDSLAGTRFESIERLNENPRDDCRLKEFWAGLQRMMSLTVQVDADGNLSTLPIAEKDEDAKRLWLGYYNGIETQQGADGEFANLRPFAGRSAEHASRLATVFAAWRCAVGGHPLQVVADDMRGAVAIAEYSLKEWQRHLSSCRLSPSEHDAQRLLAWLQDKAWHQFTLSKLAQEGANFLRKDTPRRRAAVAELCKRGWLREHASSYVLVEG